MVRALSAPSAPPALRAVVVGAPYELFANLGEGEGRLTGPSGSPRWRLNPVTSIESMQATLQATKTELVVLLGGSEELTTTAVVPVVQAVSPGSRCVVLASGVLEAVAACNERAVDLGLVGYGRAGALPSLLQLAADRWWGDPDAHVLLLVEDDPGWASAALEVMQAHAARGGAGTRVRTLWAQTYEEALAILDEVGNRVQMVISDGEYPRGGRSDRLVGLQVLAEVRRRHPEVFTLLVSADEDAPRVAAEEGLAFVGKLMDSPQDLLRAAMARAQPGIDVPHRLPQRVHGVRCPEDDALWQPPPIVSTSALSLAARGSLGGKGRGLRYLERVLATRPAGVGDVRIAIPPTLVVRDEACERFLADNGLFGLMACASALSDGEIVQSFVRGAIPAAVTRQIGEWLVSHPGPLAVRCSAALEDCRRYPLTGAFATVLVAGGADEVERLEAVLEAIKVVWASPCVADSRRLLAAAGIRHRPAMAVLVQPLVGRAHGQFFYPTFSGLASSYNYYPFRDTTPADGVAVVAMGLGKALMDGREGLRFCPRYPHAVPQLGSVKDTLGAAQRRLWALDLGARGMPEWPAEPNLVKLETARELAKGIGTAIASTYVPANDAIVDGVRQGGVPLVTFARLLRGRQLPLGPTLHWLLGELEAAFRGPVEIELAMDLEGCEDIPTLWLLQCRPLPAAGPVVSLTDRPRPDEHVVVRSYAALGNGSVSGLRDIVLVTFDLDRSRTVEVAGILERIDRNLRQLGRPYLLVGPGRWGSRDQWLGVPVAWSQVSGARAIVETDFADLIGDPSQGSHFFHHLTAAGIPFFDVHRHDEGFIDWEWLLAQPATSAACDGKVRHIELAEPIEVRVDGRRREGVVVV